MLLCLFELLEEFLALLQRRPRVAQAVRGELARMVRRTTQQVQELLWLDLPGRLAKVLLELAARHGEATPRGVRIPLRLTQAALAPMVGAARPTVNKELGWFRERGILSIDREGILLHQPELLRRRIY